MNIIVFGATGRTGQELVKQALEQGHIVTAFTRNPLKLKIAHPNLRFIKGDIIDYQIVEDAIKEQDAVLSALGAASPFKFDQSVVDGMKNIIRAMEVRGVIRLIYMSAILVKETRNNAGFIVRYIAPKLLSTEIAGHEAREKMIRQSNLRWTIVRPCTLTNGKHLALFRSGENISSGGFTVMISRADVADFMLRQLNDDKFVRRMPSVMY